MLFHSSVQRRRAAAGSLPWGLNRGDVVLLLCGVLAFIALTVLPGLLSGGYGGSVAPHETVAAQAPVTQGPATPGPISESTAPAAEQAPATPHLPVAAAPTRITYPKAGMDVLIHPLQPSAQEIENQTIEPPATMDGYWLTPYGMPGEGSSNTTYILGHSWEDRDAPFNHLSAAAASGDELEVATASGTMRYKVDSVTTYLKWSLKDSPIREVVPNRLVLVSCFTEDPWGKNVVVVASPVVG